MATGTWEPIIERATYESLMAMQPRANREYVRSSNAHKYLLTSIARCGLCGNGLNGRPSRGGQYVCLPSNGGCGKILRKQEPLDGYIDELVIQVLSTMGAPRVEPKDDLLASVRSQELRLKELQAAYGDRLISLADFLPLAKKERDHLDELRRELGASATPSPDETYIDKWRSGSVATKRAIVRQLIEAVEVRPASKVGSRNFDYGAINVIWK